MNYGDLQLKKKGLVLFNNSLIDINKKYLTIFWDEIHKLTIRIYSDDCDEIEAVKLLIMLMEKLLEGCYAKECDLNDLHYVQQMFTNIDFIYTQGRLYDYYDGELYDIVEYLDHHNNLSDMVREFKQFKDYFNRVSNKDL